MTGVVNNGVHILTPNQKFVPSGSDSCEQLGEVFQGEETYIFGYPISLYTGGQSEIDFKSPVIRRGIISQINYLSGKLIIDSAVYGGNSGGPVVVVKHVPEGTLYDICGIATQYVPVITKVDSSLGITNSALVNSGYGVVEPIDYALELINK
jgi:hypothetical protein